MKVINVKQAPVMSANSGINKEWSLCYTLTGEIREKHDNVAFDKGSDIEPLHMSVKASHFTLASRLDGETLESKVDNYFERVASDKFAYVSESNKAYIMNATEFRLFLMTFTSLERASAKNGGQYTVRAKRESKIMIEWLESLSRKAQALNLNKKGIKTMYKIILDGKDYAINYNGNDYEKALKEFNECKGSKHYTTYLFKDEKEIARG